MKSSKRIVAFVVSFLHFPLLYIDDDSLAATGVDALNCLRLQYGNRDLI